MILQTTILDSEVKIERLPVLLDFVTLIGTLNTNTNCLIGQIIDTDRAATRRQQISGTALERT